MFSQHSEPLAIESVNAIPRCLFEIGYIQSV